ncbi:MAG: HAD family phosphatase, partial [Patescibacteria group bacterium]
MPIKVIIFDVDGVLFNTDEIYFMYLQKTLREIGIKIDQEFYAFHGYDDCIYSLSLSQREIAAVKKKMKKRYYGDGMITHVRMNSGILPILKSLFPVMRLAIGSGEKKSQIQKYLDHFFISEFFTFIGHGRLVPGRKSNPAYFYAIANHYGVKPSECLHIGDSLVDQYAFRAGMQVAIIQTPYFKYLSFDPRCHILKSIESLPLLLKR